MRLHREFRRISAVLALVVVVASCRGDEPVAVQATSAASGESGGPHERQETQEPDYCASKAPADVMRCDHEAAAGRPVAPKVPGTPSSIVPETPDQAVTAGVVSPVPWWPSMQYVMTNAFQIDEDRTHIQVWAGALANAGVAEAPGQRQGVVVVVSFPYDKPIPEGRSQREFVAEGYGKLTVLDGSYPVIELIDEHGSTVSFDARSGIFTR